MSPLSPRKRPFRALRPAALVVAGGLALAACGSSETTASEAPAAEEAASVFSGEFQTLSGETFDLGSLEGQDVVLWFWAPW